MRILRLTLSVDFFNELFVTSLYNYHQHHHHQHRALNAPSVDSIMSCYSFFFLPLHPLFPPPFSISHSLTLSNLSLSESLFPLLSIWLPLLFHSTVAFTSLRSLSLSLSLSLALSLSLSLALSLALALSLSLSRSRSLSLYLSGCTFLAIRISLSYPQSFLSPRFFFVDGSSRQGRIAFCSVCKFWRGIETDRWR